MMECGRWKKRRAADYGIYLNDYATAVGVIYILVGVNRPDEEEVHSKPWVSCLATQKKGEREF
jgi:hypothetical protein